MGAREAEAVKRSLAKLAYLVAVVEGCACIVEDMEERQHDPRLWSLAAALNSCKADLDALDELLSETFDA